MPMSTLQDFIDALPSPTLVIDHQERVSAANDRVRQVLGVGLRGRHYITVLRQPNLLDAIERVLKGAELAETTYLGTDGNRDTIWKVTVGRLPAGAAAAAVVSFEDQTSENEAGQMRRDFVANVSHELKTPLTALMGFIETLQGAASEDPAARQKFLSIMSTEASRMDRLVGDLLSLSRVESQERVPPSDQVDLRGVVQRVVRSLAPLAETYEVTLEFDEHGPVPMVQGDDDQIAQVATNLIENAIKYSGRGASVSVSVSESDHSGYTRGPAAILKVEDTGEQIDPIHIPRLTERFYRIDDHRSRERGGTGLGLAIVKHILNRHRGRLRVESRAGRGNSFSVILPKK